MKESFIAKIIDSEYRKKQKYKEKIYKMEQLDLDESNMYMNNMVDEFVEDMRKKQ